MTAINNKKNILISPLYWGTGHATRVQVLARELKKRGHRIIIAAPPALHKIFDSSAYDELTGSWSPRLSYPRFLPLYLGVLVQLPLLLAAFIYDRHMAVWLIRRYNIDILISDNRFGMRSPEVHSIYITHQPRVIVPQPFAFAGNIVSAIHRRMASAYDECWIPDLPGTPNISGRLSHGCKLPPATSYIGILSRFTPGEKDRRPCAGNHRVAAGSNGSGNDRVAAGSNGSVNDRVAAGSNSAGSKAFTLAILSGPEPRRTMLEKIIISRKDSLPGHLVIVAGKPGDRADDQAEGITRHAWLDGQSLRQLMCDAHLIICRSGYSTIMDLFALGRTACLVPTPGQPEQEYLAVYLSASHGFTAVSQAELASAVSTESKEHPNSAGGARRAHAEKWIKAQGSAPSENTDWNAESRMLLEKALDRLFRKQPSSAT